MSPQDQEVLRRLVDRILRSGAAWTIVMTPEEFWAYLNDQYKFTGPCSN